MISAIARALPVVAVLAGAVSGDGLAGGGAPAGALQPHWTEVSWPFPIDKWGTGRAFHCGPEACGVGVDLYLRPKLGFCNCARGVYNDSELDRVGDLALLGSDYAGIGAGREVQVGWMTGRSRVFTVTAPHLPPIAATAIAFNDRCDVVVATVTAGADPSHGTRPALDFLNSDLVLRWARSELGADGS